MVIYHFKLARTVVGNLKRKIPKSEGEEETTILKNQGGNTLLIEMGYIPWDRKWLMRKK